MSDKKSDSSKAPKRRYALRFVIYFFGIFFYLSPFMVAGDSGIMRTIAFLIEFPLLSAASAAFLILFGIIWRAIYRYFDTIFADKGYKAPLCISWSVACMLLAVYLGYNAMHEMPSLEGWNFFLPTTYFNDEGHRSARLPMLVILIPYYAPPAVLLVASVKFWIRRNREPVNAGEGV